MCAACERVSGPLPSWGRPRTRDFSRSAASRLGGPGDNRGAPGADSAERRHASLMSTPETIAPSPPAEPEEETSLLVSVVIPCLNEAENIERCLLEARAALQRIDG